MGRTKVIDGELAKLRDEIIEHAIAHGLDFHEVIFEVCNYDTINILAAQGGFPSRYPHWRFGMEYDQLSKGYTYGIQKIYEMVINTNPCYAYLLNANHIVDQKIVMAHVYGHADFFKNNFWFSNTNRNMMDVMANHGTKIRRYMDRYGQDRIEAFIDTVLSLDNLLDINVLFETEELKRTRRETDAQAIREVNSDEGDDRSQALQSFMRTKKKNENKDEKIEIDTGEGQNSSINGKWKNKGADLLPTKDVMNFLLQHAPLKEWESDILGILREEAYYFLPQRLTKIMNEGWASYWHSKIMTQNALRASEIIDFADHHAGVMAMSRQRINPYKIGIELFRDIEYRWNTGKFGKEYQDCNNMAIKGQWDTKLGEGMKKIFEVRKSHNDITFIDEFFTQEFCERQQLFTYKYNPRTGRNEIDARDFQSIKDKLLNQLTNFGSPVIEIVDSNFGNRSELLLQHQHQGVDLDIKFTSDTLKNIFSIWKRPVNLKTINEEKETCFVFDGKEMRTRA